jgi:hypothetical protein
LAIRPTKLATPCIRPVTGKATLADVRLSYCVCGTHLQHAILLKFNLPPRYILRTTEVHRALSSGTATSLKPPADQGPQRRQLETTTSLRRRLVLDALDTPPRGKAASAFNVVFTLHAVIDHLPDQSPSHAGGNILNPRTCCLKESDIWPRATATGPRPAAFTVAAE